MKRILVLWIIVWGWGAHAQEQIEVSFDKKVILLFEDNILGFELGDNTTVGCITTDNRIILQSPKEWGDAFYETNLLVWTNTGYYFTFIITYNNNPSSFFHVIKNRNARYQDFKTPKGDKQAEEGSDIEIDSICSLLIKSENYIFTLGTINKKMELAVVGIYVDELYLYVETYIYNSADINYDIELISFFINGKGENRRIKTAVQKENLTPIFIKNGGVKTIERQMGIAQVFVFKKFTIDMDKELAIELNENNGDRNLITHLRANDIIDAKNVTNYLNGK